LFTSNEVHFPDMSKKFREESSGVGVSGGLPLVGIGR
jgi:hypothetical protein